MNKFILTLTISLMLLLEVAGQQQYSFLQVNSADGLVSNRITCIHKGSRGFIWIGTKAGLSRYDGVRVVNYKHDSNDSTSLPNNYIIKIQEDASGNLLIQTGTAFFVYNIHKEKFCLDINKYLGIKPGALYIEGIYCDRNKEIWIKTYHQRYYQKWNRDKHVLEDKFQSTIKEETPLIDFKHANNAYYYLFSDGRIECYDELTFDLLFTNDFLLGKAEGGSLTPGIFVDKENDIWFYGNNNGVFHYNSLSGEWTNYSKNKGNRGLSSDIIYEVIQDDKGLMWVATDHGGINIINKYSGEIVKLKHQSDNDKSIAGNSVTDLYVDDNHIIWAATNKNGVSYYHESIHKFQHYRNLLSDSNSLPFNDVNCFLEDKIGNLWIGTNGGGLVYYNRALNTYKTYKYNKYDTLSLSSNVVMSLFIDGQENLWIGTYAGGVNRFDGHHFKRYQFKTHWNSGLMNDNIWSIIEDKDHQIWIGTNGGGIEIYDKDKDLFYPLHNNGQFNIPTKYIADLHQLANGNVLVGTAYGAFLYDTKEQRYKRIPGLNEGLSFVNKVVNAVFEDSRGLYWLATNEGLIVVDPHSSYVKAFTREDGLPEHIMNCIVEDEFQTIWVSKSTGLSQIIVHKSSRDKEYNFHIYHFTEADGLQANEFNPNAGYKTKNNELLFGGVNGFNLFKSKNIKSNKALCKVMLTGLQVYNQNVLPDHIIRNVKLLDESITTTKQIVLKHSMNVFSIDFAALNYFIPEKINYKYKLEGFNEEWLTLNNVQPRVSYTNLNAGEYVFKVKASNNDGVWGDDYTSLKISVLPPFYATPIAYVMYGLFFFLILIYYRFSALSKERLKFSIEQERLLSKKNHEMDEMKLRFLTNVSHEFRTPLTLILTPLHKLLAQDNSMANRKLLEVIDRNAHHLLRLVNQLLDFRKLELHGMRYNPSYGDIVSFLHGVIGNFQEAFEKKNIDFQFLHDKDSFMFNFDSDKLQKVIMNLLSNALKFTPPKGMVKLKLNVDQQLNMVCILIKDNGIGIRKEDMDKIFERFYQSAYNQKLGLSGSGIGLNLAKEMVLLHKGTIAVESTEGEGAAFTVRLPVEISQDNEENVMSKSEQHALDSEKNVSIKGKPLVLLVEDNDDFRTFMRDALYDQFTVLEAADGEIGYEMVQQKMPDLIISDVMMPNKDGLDLCRMLRADIKTSHIPMILLTARTADEDKIRGLEYGADDYITKPFNMELLILRINSLLQKRSEMQKEFQKTIEINPSEVHITSMDEKLMKKAIELVEENIAEPDFSVIEFSKKLGMSRVHLYKKLTAITGKSPVEFIRIIRLKRGAQLLEKSQMSIAEVAYAVGFNSPRYFSKYFKEEYGMLPTAYVKAHAVPSHNKK
ncbi:hybrid sensor histidine kinase/response regulator transcription factor [Saccharicrinis fermentans]|nr:hybrid sensor histidine kinase/response regulator transcription factor [Saccharicrinis fermentans]